MASQRIVIIGGGFGGVKCAQTLRRQLRPGDAELILFNKENHLVFSPLLADAVGSSLSLHDVIVPLRQLLPGVQCRTEEVKHVDLAGSRIEYESHDGQPRSLDYDHVVLACGNISNLNVVPGMADHAFPLKTVGDAAVLRTHVLSALEKAEVCDDPEKRRWYLSFIVVGGGYSGVETAGEINDLVRSSLRFYSNIREDDISVTLIHSRDQLLPEISPQLREFARKKMEKAGVTMRLNARVMLATGEGVGLKDGFVRGGTVVCTIGSTIAPVVERLDTPKEKGRLLTQTDMRLRDRTNAWAIGDCANILNAHDGQSSPPPASSPSARAVSAPTTSSASSPASQPARSPSRCWASSAPSAATAPWPRCSASNCPASSHGSSGAVSISSSSRHSRAACRSASTGRGC